MPVRVAGLCLAGACALVLSGGVAGAADPEGRSLDDTAREAGQKFRAEAAQRRAALAQPAAKARRRASREAFSGQSTSQAKATLRDKVAALAQAPAFATDDLVKDGEITRFLDSHSAQVRWGDGRTCVMVSPAPLQVPADGGGEG